MSWISDCLLEVVKGETKVPPANALTTLVAVSALSTPGLLLLLQFKPELLSQTSIAVILGLSFALSLPLLAANFLLVIFKYSFEREYKNELALFEGKETQPQSFQEIAFLASCFTLVSTWFVLFIAFEGGYSFRQLMHLSLGGYACCAFSVAAEACWDSWRTKRLKLDREKRHREQSTDNVPAQ